MLLLIPISSVLLTNMFIDFMDEGMIFSFWRKVLNKLPTQLAKPIGGCGDCTNIWAFFLMFALYYKVNIAWVLIFGASLSHLLFDIYITLNNYLKSKL